MPDISVGHVFRYRAAASVTSYAIRTQDILNCLLTCITTTTTTRQCASVKVVKVEVWGAPASDGASATVAVEFTQDSTTVGARRQSHSDTTVTTARPAYLCAHPAPGSLASMWLSDSESGSTFMEITCPIGGIVDLHYSLVFRNTEVHIAGQTAVGASVGYVYTCSVNDAADLVPVGRVRLPI